MVFIITMQTDLSNSQHNKNDANESGRGIKKIKRCKELTFYCYENIVNHYDTIQSGGIRKTLVLIFM